jgi:(2Fe-2S) ferredoxin
MGKSTVKRPFSLDGRLLGFEGDKPEAPKYLKLWTPHGEYQIKLRKDLRATLPHRLIPGEWIYVFGRRKEDVADGTQRFKAEIVTLANPKVRDNQAIEAVSAPIAPQPSVAEPAPKPTGNLTKSAKASILVCRKSKCCKQGGQELCRALETALDDRGLKDQVVIKETGCMKRCKAGPNLIVMPDKARYSQITAQNAAALVDRHFPVD